MNRLWYVTIYATNRCNLTCLNCHIWKKMPKEDLSVEVIKNLVSEKIVKNSSFEIQGGEIILHPCFEEIMELFRGRPYVLLSNGFLAEEIIAACKKYAVPNLHLSLDGATPTNSRIRGKDTFSTIKKIVEELHGTTTKIIVTYTVCPENNNESDFVFVKNFCERYNLKFNVNIYGNQFYFDVPQKSFRIDKKIIDLVDDELQKKYLELYNEWVDGEIKLPCLNIFVHTIIWSNGDVTLCQQKPIVIGNIYKESLTEIWNSREARNTRKNHKSCNDCWLACHKLFDLELTNPKRHK